MQVQWKWKGDNTCFPPLPLLLCLYTQVYVHSHCACVRACVKSYQSKKTLLLSDHSHLPPFEMTHDHPHARSNVDKGGKGAKYALESFTVIEFLGGGVKYNLNAHRDKSMFTHTCTWLWPFILWLMTFVPWLQCYPFKGPLSTWSNLPDSQH